jgi:transcriptional regulator with XRE-family HTH domain
MSKIAVSDTDRSVGRRIQIRRRELGLTALVLSERVGMSQQQLSRYERGQNKIGLAHLVNIAVYTQTPISWFFLECIADYQQRYLKEDLGRYNMTMNEHELAQRLQQLWQALSNEKRQAVIAFLDRFSG